MSCKYLDWLKFLDATVHCGVKLLVKNRAILNFYLNRPGIDRSCQYWSNHINIVLAKPHFAILKKNLRPIRLLARSTVLHNRHPKLLSFTWTKRTRHTFNGRIIHQALYSRDPPHVTRSRSGLIREQNLRSLILWSQSRHVVLVYIYTCRLCRKLGKAIRKCLFFP